MDQFIDQLMKDASFGKDLAPEILEQVRKDLTTRATDMVNRYIIDSMSDDVFKQFEAMVNQEGDLDPKTVQDFIEKNVPNREEIATRALLEFRTVYMGANA
jgi:hypothetical protein